MSTKVGSCGDSSMNKPKSVGHTFVEIENPYHIYDPKREEEFYHADVIKRIQTIFDPQKENRPIVLQGKPGSWKTGTLKKIENSPEMLGENHVPIYLNAADYAGLDIDDLSFSLYKDIIEKLNKKGYNIPRPDYFRERRKKNGDSSTLQYILLAIASNLSRGEILVVILDEMDTFLEKTNTEIIASFIRYIKNIEQRWNKYRLIMSGDKELVDLTLDEMFKNLLKSAEKIDLDELLKEENIRRLIVEPVETRLKYADAAVDKIVYYSGGNLFFQQLICHYLVAYLNEKRQDFCQPEDVDNVIKRILAETREDFAFFWENKFSQAARLIASALADERVMENKEGIYIFKENAMLDDILGKELYKEIDKLYNYGYLNAMKERQFKRFPFKIAIFGLWIIQEHTFIKTVLQNIDAAADRVNLDTIIEEIENTPEKELLPFDKPTILDIACKWRSLSDAVIKDRSTIQRDQLEVFFKSFIHRIGLDFKIESASKENYFIIDIKNLKIGFMDEALCFIQDRPALGKNDISFIEKQATGFAKEAQNRLTIFFYFRRIDEVEELVNKRYLNLVAIDEIEFKKIILSDRPQQAAGRIIFSKLSLMRLSPYRIAGPAEATFYGRRETIDKISGNLNKSFAVVGARKIGKSSLLHRLNANPPAGITYISMNMEFFLPDARSYWDFFKELQSRFEKRFNKKVDFKGFLGGVDFSKFTALIKELYHDGHRIIFIIDEIDGLIAFDRKNSFKLLRLFRSLSEENLCQFIFAGFEELFLNRRDIKNPLYNFCDEIILEPLDREAALDLITKPMQSIGIHYKNDIDRDAILEYTGCHPNLLQFFCTKLIESLEKRRQSGAKRIIFKEDIESLYDAKYEEFIMDDVYMFFKLTNIDQLILMLLVEDRSNGKIFSANTINDKLVEEGIKIAIFDILQHLNDLCLRFILRLKERDNYEFALPSFPDILRKWTDEFYKNRIKLEVKADEQ